MIPEEPSFKGAAAPFFVPSLSIVIPVHNQWQYTKACITSLFRHPPDVSFEIIVVDDGSSDETEQQLERWAAADPRIRFTRNGPPHRFARACNHGARQAHGHYLLFLNNDIELHQAGWFRPLRQVLEEHPDVGIAVPLLLFPDGSIQHCGKVWYLDEDGLPRSVHERYEQLPEQAGPLSEGARISVTGACMLIRREQFFTYGPFDERYENGWEDDDLCLAFRSQGLLSWVCPESIMIHHQGGTLKAEAAVLERYLRLLRSKGISFSSDDPLVAGLAGRARDESARFEHIWRRNRQHFLEKWQDSVKSLIDAATRNGTGLPLSTEHTPPPLALRAAVTIIIVTYNSADTVDACLDSIAATIRHGDAVVVVDNASRDRTIETVQRHAAVLPLQLVNNASNRGYAAAANQGVRLAQTPYVVLLNPDTVVTAGWLDLLQSHFADNAVAAVGPVSNFAAGRQSVACHWDGPLPDSIAPDQAAARISTRNRGTFEKSALLIGFCLMLRRYLPGCSIEMDERLFLGNDDLELSWRLRLHGYELVIATDCFVYHKGQHSFRTDPATVTGRLVRESSTALYRILADCYGCDRVPLPEHIWDIDWFCAEQAVWNGAVRWDQVLFRPQPWVRPESLVSLVILTCNQWDYTEQCLAAIVRHTPEPYELIVIDNGSTDGTVERLQKLAASDCRLRLILNMENRGFAAGCNQGIAAACGEFIVLLNNDVVVTPEWLSGLLECHRSHSLAGIVGPMTNRASGVQVVAEPEYAMPEGLDGFSRRFRSANRFRFVPSRRIVGFCMLFHRSLLEKTGLLDEQFGTGNYEDDDICLRAAVEGYRNVVAGDVYLHHYGSVSFIGNRIDYRSALARNAALFREKWSRPVSDPVMGTKIAACRLRHDLESLIMDEQLASALARIQADTARYQGDRLLAELVTTVRSLAGPTLSEGESQGDSPGMQLLARSREVKARGEDEYAAALLLAGFRLEPWRPESLASVLELAQDDVQGLDKLVDQAFRLYPESRGLARLRVQLAARERKPVAVEWAEAFVAGFGPDDQVMDAGLAVRRELEDHCGPSPAGVSVSLCMIIKDEEQNLARCLASCKPVVSEMVVVDTGSSDRSVLIAELFGAKVENCTWHDDFSAARNRSLEMAAGDWLLIMDADEALSVRDHAAFNEVLAGADKRSGYIMTTRNYTANSSLAGFIPCRGEYPENEAGSGWTASDKVRLFPNGFGIHFSGSVHEMVEPSLQAAGLSVKHHPVPVHHYGGLDQNRLAEKRLRYLGLGLKKLEQQPGDPKALYELAVQAAELQRFESAEYLWRELLKSQPAFAKGWFNLGYALLNQNRFEEALQATEQSLRLEPDLRDALVNRALCEACLYSGDAALRSAEEALERCPDHPVIMTLAALAFYRTGRTEEGRQLTRLLVEKGVLCKAIYERILLGSSKTCPAREQALIRQAIGELSFSS